MPVSPPSLRVALLELPYRYGDVGAALAEVSAVITELRDVDLVLLAEAALTGYVSPRGDFDLSRFAEPVDGPAVTALRALARDAKVALGFPLIEAAGARRFNSYLVADGEGALVLHYRKRRPWMPERWATPGDLGTPTLTLAGVRLTIAVCYDIHTVSRMAREALDASDALIFPSSWVDDGVEDLRAALLPRVARRHDLWVLNPNWGDDAPVWFGGGRSQVIGPDGARITEAPRGAGPHVVRATVTGGRGRRGT